MFETDGYLKEKYRSQEDKELGIISYVHNIDFNEDIDITPNMMMQQMQNMKTNNINQFKLNNLDKIKIPKAQKKMLSGMGISLNGLNASDMMKQFGFG